MKFEPKIEEVLDPGTELIVLRSEDLLYLLASITACCLNKKQKTKATKIILQFVSRLQPCDVGSLLTR